MRVLTTGGLGHIGSALLVSRDFREKVEHLKVVDNLSSERYCSLFNVPFGPPVAFKHQDVRELSSKDLRATDVLVHLAAQTDATASLDQRDSVFRNNLEGTRHVVRLASETGTKLVFASTTSVYGSQESRVDETCDLLVPQSPYAECKLEEEELVRQASRDGLEAIILRLGTIAGPSPGMRFHTAVNKFCIQARLQEPLSVWRTAWHQLRPYLDVQDAVRVLTWALTLSMPAALSNDPVLNVVTENLSVEQVVRAVEAAFGPVEVEFTESPIMNQLSYEVETARIVEMGFSAGGSIFEAVKETARLLSGVSG
jgi:UDP-glucose 4-epimerase